MNLFPNPAKGQVRMSWDDVCDGTIRVFDLEGRVMKSVVFSHTDNVTISIADLAQGCYTVIRVNLDGTLMETKKLIVK